MERKLLVARCACGRVPEITNPTEYAQVSKDGGWSKWNPTWRVGCAGKGTWLCFQGPERKTRHGAVSAWNKVMRAAKEAKDDQ